MRTTLNHLTPLLAALCLLGTSATNNKQGCLYTTYIPGRKEPTCVECYHRKPNNPKGAGCGPLLPDSDTCAFYFNSPDAPALNDGCTRCKPGYSLDTSAKQCTTGRIQGCVDEFTVNNYPRPLCNGCLNGQYALTYYNNSYAKACVPASEVSAPIENCLWGGIYQRKRFNPRDNRYIPAVITCYRCKPGYSLTITSPERCVPAKFVGCLQIDRAGNGCAACDVYDGYSMQPEGSCLKVGDEGRPLIKSLD